MILIDTHILIWMWERPARISRRAATAIARASTVLISPISFFEIARLIRLNRVRLDRELFDWARAVLDDPRVTEAPLSSAAAVSAGLLGDAFPGDPHDRLLYATARDLAVPFVSKDHRLRDFASGARDVRVVW